ncbi:MAG: 30S ribosomal protein S17 [Dehalococcoidia bacterium]|nr:30S ribosomal protein S17 [Dehalococcoidia bacterium]
MADNKHKTMIGRVVSARMNKTCIVAVEKQKQHPLYRKTYRLEVKYKVHDEKGECQADDRVRIVETRPLSKEKRWRVAEIISKAAVVEIKPGEVV